MSKKTASDEVLPWMTVVGGAANLAMPDWREYAADVGRALGLEPSYLALSVTRVAWLPTVLRVSAGVPWPVLVLPLQRLSVPATPKSGPRLQRVLLASDGSPEIVNAARSLAGGLRRQGIATTVLVVLNVGTTPPIWEGAGHHAAAWRSETTRRHGYPNHLEVVTGPPEERIPARIGDADLVVLAWHQVAAEDRAAVVRAVIDDGAGPPCLLVPFDWMKSNRRMWEPVGSATAVR